MSMFSFQAIHNASVSFLYAWMLFIDYVNVLFSSNSQPIRELMAAGWSCLSIMSMFSFQAIHNRYERKRETEPVVYRLCQCSLFKQFTTGGKHIGRSFLLFIDYVNVLFSSNSQLPTAVCRHRGSCLSIMSMFSFQAIHNYLQYYSRGYLVVYRLCQCSLFKQFTTFK